MNRAQYEEQRNKTNELTKTAEELLKEQENNAEMLKNAKVELEEKESELKRNGKFYGEFNLSKKKF